MSNNEILCLFWQPGDTLGGAISTTLRRMGYSVNISLHGLPLPERVQTIVTYGPMGRLEGLQHHLSSQPEKSRPELIFWQTEQFPDPSLPVWMVNIVVKGLYAQKRLLSTRGNRFRYLAELRQLQRDGLVTVLGVTSEWVGEYLSRFGLETVTAYMGSCADWGSDLGLERDIQVLWLGRAGSRRRTKLLNKVRTALNKRGVDLLMIDGIEHEPVLGDARVHLINRTRIILNLLRESWDDNSMRYFLAAPNKAMIVSEPTLRHTPFVPGVHLVEAVPEQIADTICYYLNNEEERRNIAENAWNLVTQELTMESSLKRLLGVLGR